MRWKKTLQLIDVHCEGETGKIVTAGLPGIPGSSIAEKLVWMNTKGHGLRRFLTLEPRGAVAGSVNVLLPATCPEADVGFIVLQADQAYAMSGSNSMCLVTALLETGMVEMREPETVVTLDTASGLVRASATCADGRCERVTLQMTPAFVETLDAGIDTREWGRIRYDVGYGGVFYAIVDVRQIGMEIKRRHARELAAAGVRLRELIRGQYPVRHPDIPEIEGIAYVMFRDIEQDGAMRTCTTLWPGRVDRSPCGTGSTVNLATMYARGLAKIGDELTSRSIIDSEFRIKLVEETKVADKIAIRAALSGRSWIVGFHQTGLDPDDPFPEGFVLSDTWGPLADDIV